MGNPSRNDGHMPGFQYPDFAVQIELQLALDYRDNLFMRVVVPDVKTLHDLLMEQLKVKGIHATETFLILDTYMTKDLSV